MKLKSILKTLAIPHLERIQAHWGISPIAIDGAASEEEAQALLIANLYQRLQNRALWERATKSMTAEERGLVNFLAIHGGDLDAEEVATRYFERDVRRMTAVVTSLGERGIVFFDNVPDLSTPLLLVGIPEPFLRYIELPSYWEGYLGNFLKELNNNELKHIATQGLRLEVESNCKNYLVWTIRRALLDPRFLRRHVERLTPIQRELLQLLEQRRGACVYRDLLELNVQRHYDHQRVDALHWLLNTSGVVFTAVPGGNKYNNLLMIPRDVFHILSNNFAADTRTFKELDSVSVVTKERTPTVIVDNSNTVLRDLVALCNLIDRYPVKELATGGIGKNDLKKFLPSLSRFKSVKYAELLSLFAIQKKFLVSTGESYRVSHSFLKWLENAQAAYVDLLTWWLATSDWNEEFLDGNTVHVEPPVSGLVNIVPMRRLALEVLRDMPKDRWCRFDAYVEELQPRIAQEIPRRGEPLTYEKHTRGNDVVVESILAECLYWLGIVAIGVQHESDLDSIGMRVGDGKTLKARGDGRGRPRKQHEIEFSFRLTDLGRYVLGFDTEEWPRLFTGSKMGDVQPFDYNTDQFIVQPTLEVIVPPDLRLSSFYHLNEICEVKSIDVMSILTITKASIRDGMDRGLRAEEMLAFLQRSSRTALPESLAVLIRECADKHGEVNMGFAGGYILVDDDGLLERVRANKKIAPAIKDVIDNRVVMLNPDTDVKRLARELQKIGFMPRLASEHVHMKDEDTYHFSLTREDMYTLIAAVRYANEVTDEKGRRVAEERLAPLLERLRPDPRSAASLTDLSEPLVRMWTRAAEAGIEARINSVRDSFNVKLTQLATVTPGRTGTRHQYEGPNPATGPAEVRALLEFALDHELEVELDYVKTNQEEVHELVAIESLERDRLLARSKSRQDAFSVFKVDRIIRARLT